MIISCLIPPFYDFLCSTIVEGLKELSHEIYVTDDINVDPHSDFFFLFSNAGYRGRKDFLIRSGYINRTVYIDGSDGNNLEDPDALNDFHFIFKRELMINDERKILPLPFAAENIYFKFNDIKKDISVSSTLRCGYNRKREIINKIVKDLNIPDTVIGEISRGYSASSSTDEQKLYYYKILARSKISISYPGLGWDTGRFWEILANKCLLFSPEIQIKMPDPFIAFKHYIPYDENDLKDKVLHYLNHKDEMNEIASAGHNHLLKYHTTKSRAEYLVNKL